MPAIFNLDPSQTIFNPSSTMTDAHSNAPDGTNGPTESPGQYRKKSPNHSFAEGSLSLSTPLPRSRSSFQSHRPSFYLLTALNDAQDAGSVEQVLQPNDVDESASAAPGTNPSQPFPIADGSMDSIHSLLAASQQLAQSTHVPWAQDGHLADSVSVFSLGCWFDLSACVIKARSGARSRDL